MAADSTSTVQEPLLAVGGPGGYSSGSVVTPLVKLPSTTQPSPIDRRVIGCGLVMAIVCFNLWLTMTAADLSSHVRNPFFLVFFNVSFDAVYLLAIVAQKLWPSISSLQSNVPLPTLFKTASLLMVVYQLGNLLWFYGLQLAPLPTAVTLIIYQSSALWVFLFSLLFRLAVVSPLRSGLAVAVCLAGVGLIATDELTMNLSENTNRAANASGPRYADGLIMPTIGSLSGSALLWALYEVLFYWLLPEANTAAVVTFVGFRGLSNLLVLSIPFACWGEVPVLDQDSLNSLMAFAVASAVITFLVCLGIAVTSPVLVRIGTTFAVPVAVAISVTDGARPGWACYTGTCLIGVAVAATVYLQPSGTESIKVNE
jgi:hypothetical protein